MNKGGGVIRNPYLLKFSILDSRPSTFHQEWPWMYLMLPRLVYPPPPLFFWKSIFAKTISLLWSQKFILSFFHTLIHYSVHLFNLSFIHHFNYVFLGSFIALLFIYLSWYSFIYPSIHLSILVFIYLSYYLFIYPSIHLSILVFIYLS